MKAGENTDTILSVMEHLHQPMFLLDVLGPESFVFRGLNKEHQAESGLTNDMVFGKSPHEALPSRLADTIVQNYERCRATGQAHTYEELLELPTGPLWWQTTLSPVFDDHRKLTQIIGLAVDITKRKEAEFGASQRLSDMTRLNEDLQVFASTTAQDMRGPFQTMVALLDMVSDGFVDLGDEKADQLALCREIAEDAITSMGAILSTAQGLRVATDTQEEVDLGHLAADIAALLDPHERFEIELPQAQIKTDRVAIQMVLRNLMENAIRYTDKKVSVHVAAFKDALSGEMIAVTISDDGVGIAADKRIDGQPILPPSGQIGADFGVNSAQAVIIARGGHITRVQSTFATGAAIRFTLPGALLSVSSAFKTSEIPLKEAPFQMPSYARTGMVGSGRTYPT